MILKIQLCLVVVVAWISHASCVSVSKVYFQQNGVETLPVEYYTYGSPTINYGSPHVARYEYLEPQSAVVPVSSYVSPCVGPCVYPGPAVTAPVAPVPSANLVSYQSPVSSLPVVVAPTRNEPLGYEYSYAVYDQSTGDKKSHSELSDGSIVRGEYSYLQPDGYVQEVRYVADELRGYNAIVKHFLPASEEKTKVEVTALSNSAPPCPEVKSEPIKQLDSEENTSDEKNTMSIEHEEDPQPEVATESKEITEESKESPPQENLSVESVENSASKEEVSSKEEPETTVEPKSIEENSQESTDVLVPYKDIMKCIEAFLNKHVKEPILTTESPLAYIVLNKPC